MSDALTGQQVASTNVAGALTPGSILLTGLQGWIDVERQKALAEIPDTATVNAAGIAQAPAATRAPAAPSAVQNVAATIKGLAPWQWGGLAVAAFLGYLLYSGHFE